MADELSLDDLVALTGEPAERLLEWQSHGLLTQRNADQFSEQDVLRARVVQIVLRRGLDLDVVVQLQRDMPFLDHEVERLFPRGLRPRFTIEEAVEEVEADPDLIERLVRAGSLLDEDGLLSQTDVRSLRTFAGAVKGGFPEEVLLQTFRVFADVTERAAQASLRAFHMYVHERFRASGMSPEAALDATQAVSRAASADAEPALVYFFRKARIRAIRDDAALHVAENAGLLSIPQEAGEVTRAIMFVDLSSFTPLTEALGDRAAADVLQRLSGLVRDATSRAVGHVVKQIGDAFMLAFPDAGAAVRAALEIEEGVSAEPTFPAAHSGIHCGRVLYRDGDYVGTVVNVAARLIAEAERHEIVVTAAARDEAKRIPGLDFVALGKRQLKGIGEAVEIFGVQRPRAESTDRTIDPVCGMELGAEEAVARLVVGGAERTFCSDNCLRLFVEAPERYR